MMNFLPLLTRELQTAARRPSTYWLRLAVGGIAMLVCFMFLGWHFMFGGAGSVGAAFFLTLTWYAVILCMFGGAFMTADTLSEERREGTMGLLYLTNLRGHDVVAGKFVGVMLNAFYGLFALMPLLALPLLMGGVTLGEFGRTILLLTTTLLMSASAGLFASSVSREVNRSTLIAFGLVAASTPLLVFALWNARDVMYSLRSSLFWTYLGWCYVISIVLLLLSTRFVFAYWQRSERQLKPPSHGAVPWWRYRKVNTPLLDIHPITWLSAGKSFTGARVNWFIVGTALLTTGCGWYIGDPMVNMIASVINSTLSVLLAIRLAFQSTHFFVEARRSGALELLLCTPLAEQELVKGQMASLKKNFFWPLTTLIAVTGFWQIGSVLVSEEAWLNNPTGVFALGLTAYGVLVSAMGFWATAWLGLWLGLTAKKPGWATGWTLFMTWFVPLVVFLLPDAIIYLVMVSYVRQRLTQDFRRHALKRICPEPAYNPQFPPLPPAGMSPPVLPAS